MTDTLFADVSSWQVVADDTYPFHFIAFRSNDGTYKDPNFEPNLKWAAGATGKQLLGFFVYFVYEDNVHATVATLKSLIGATRPFWTRDKYRRMGVVIDLESWSGKLTGDHSRSVRVTREAIIQVLNQRRIPMFRKLMLSRDRKRVLVYGNGGDLRSLAPQTGDALIGLAAYGSNPAYPNKVYHQFADNYPVPPFGRCDINSADGKTPYEFAVACGLAPPRKAGKVVKPKTHPHPATGKRVYVVQQGDTFFLISQKFHVRLAALVAANPQIKNPSLVFPGEHVFIP